MCELVNVAVVRRNNNSVILPAVRCKTPGVGRVQGGYRKELSVGFKDVRENYQQTQERKERLGSSCVLPGRRTVDPLLRGGKSTFRSLKTKGQPHSYLWQRLLR